MPLEQVGPKVRGESSMIICGEEDGEDGEKVSSGILWGLLVTDAHRQEYSGIISDHEKTVNSHLARLDVPNSDHVTPNHLVG